MVECTHRAPQVTCSLVSWPQNLPRQFQPRLLLMSQGLQPTAWKLKQDSPDRNPVCQMNNGTEGHAVCPCQVRSLEYENNTFKSGWPYTGPTWPRWAMEHWKCGKSGVMSCSCQIHTRFWRLGKKYKISQHFYIICYNGNVIYIGLNNIYYWNLISSVFLYFFHDLWKI